MDRWCSRAAAWFVLLMVALPANATLTSGRSRSSAATAAAGSDPSQEPPLSSNASAAAAPVAGPGAERVGGVAVAGVPTVVGIPAIVSSVPLGALGSTAAAAAAVPATTSGLGGSGLAGGGLGDGQQAAVGRANGGGGLVEGLGDLLGKQAALAGGLTDLKAAAMGSLADRLDPGNWGGVLERGSLPEAQPQAGSGPNVAAQAGPLVKAEGGGHNGHDPHHKLSDLLPNVVVLKPKVDASAQVNDIDKPNSKLTATAKATQKNATAVGINIIMNQPTTSALGSDAVKTMALQQSGLAGQALAAGAANNLAQKKGGLLPSFSGGGGGLLGNPGTLLGGVGSLGSGISGFGGFLGRRRALLATAVSDEA